VRLLERIEESTGAVVADLMLAFVRRIMNWHAARSDDFRSPIVRGMARTKPHENARSRILTDDELRAVWATAEGQAHPFAALVRFLLLTAARRTEAVAATWAEIDGSDWVLPAANLIPTTGWGPQSTSPAWWRKNLVSNGSSLHTTYSDYFAASAHYL
jgi:integrase